MSNENEELKGLVQALTKLPPPPKLVKPEDTHVCMCQRTVPASTFTMLDTGVIKVVNNVCPDCVEGRREDTKLARIACVSCKTVVARIEPHKDVDEFTFKANHTYHVAQCGSCTPGLTESAIIEKRIHQQRLADA